MDKWLSHPTALKVLSVVIAMLLWAVVHFDPESTPAKVTSYVDTKVFETQAVQAVGLDESKYALVKLEPTVVRLVVEGRRASLLAAAAKEEAIVVQADLSNIKAGEHVVPLIYKLPKGLVLVEMTPKTVTVDLVEIQTKAFDLAVITEGNPANGYIAGSPVVEQTTNNQVNVTLPKEEMDLVGSVSTTINVEGAKKTVEEKKARIVVYDTEGDPMENAVVSPSTVSVSIRVTPPLKTMPLQLNYTGTLPEGLSITSAKAEIDKVAVYADQSVLDQMDVYQGVTIDLSKLKQSGTVKAKVTAIGDVKMVEPSEINVKVTIVSSETTTLNRIIKWTGLSDGLTSEVVTPTNGEIAIKVRAAPNVLAALRDDDVQITGDLDGLGVGKHTIKLKAELPRLVELAGGVEETLTATIEITDNSAPTDPPTDGEDVPVGGQPTDPPEEPSDEVEPGGGSGNTGSGNGSGNATDNGNGANESDSTQ